MRITVVYRDFFPDNSPYAQMLFKIAKGFARSGHEVYVLTGKPSHAWNNKIQVANFEIVEGVKIRRLPLLPEFGRKIVFRSLNVILFALQFFFCLLRGRTDLVMVVSTPPVVNAFIVRVVSSFKSFHYLYHCQDIHPEALLLVGALKNSIVFKLLLKLDTKNVIKSLATVVLSDDMKDTLCERNIDGNNIHVINNFIFEKLLCGESYQNPTSEKPLSVIFAGNLGKFQGLSVVIDAAKLLTDTNIEFIILGDGIERESLQKRAGALLGKSVHFLGHQPLQDTLRHMQSSDLGLISIMPGAINVAYPSKTMMYLSMGLSIIALTEAESSLGSFIRNNNLGYIVEIGNAVRLAETFRIASQNKLLLRSAKGRIQAIASDFFAEDIIISKWQVLLQELK